MAYNKRNISDAYDKLSYRLEALKTIEPEFDFNNGLEVEQLEQLADNLLDTLNDYNSALMDADDLRSSIEALEKQAQDVSERLLAMVLAKYGRDSMEYRRVGGTQKSQIDPTGTRPITFDPELENGSTSGGDGSDSGSGST
ncbi:hypothetical protein NC796_19725 [Aliifodinibius sp. S!AR15-10]|uniref:hypothetical protein n=1 Tax=Aliifodinibius sp. S!AR15-10 TaxID=2950437 RepID=UPI002864A2EB|nr:hypothetical protein [Aliifodinibius sp. S!AR15-10]MDR8393394.1 hypothetical protein [Aliifodinibius sp. S!AR15-10]